MKIILATPVYPPEIGGPATYTKELAERLSEDHNVTIVAYASTSEHVRNVKLITVSKRRSLLIRILKFCIVLYKAADNADIIYVQNAVAAGLPAVLVGMVRRVPVVLKFVGDEAWERATQLRLTTKHLEEFLDTPEGTPRIRLIMNLQGFVLRHATRVTTPSRYLAAAIVRAYRIPEHRVSVNYNAAEKPDVLPLPTEPKSHSIVTTARLVEWKGVAGIIRAVKRLLERFPDTMLRIAGDGPEEANLKVLARELGVEEHIEFLGRVSRAETWQLRKTSSVYVLNSTYEGLPHTVLTSFVAEIPMVATNIPGTNEAVYDRVSGLLVEPDDDEALAQAIATLFTDEALRTQLIAGGKKIVAEKFSWEAHLNTLLALFKSVCTHPCN